MVLWIQSHVCKVSITGLSPSSAELSNSILLPHLHLMTVLNPGAVARSGLASFPFARRYLENRSFFLFLWLLRCFSSPRSLSMSYIFTHLYLHITAGGFPHSDICGSSGYLLLTAAFRSLSRPSSAPSAKASTLCPFLLDLIVLNSLRESFWFFSVS